MLYILIYLAASEFKLKQTIWPEKDLNSNNYFGNAVAMSEQYVVICAEFSIVPGVSHPSKNYTGSCYIYEYDPTTDQYKAVIGNMKDNHRLQPNVSNENFMPGYFGSDVFISSDPPRILVGAPYTYVNHDLLKDVPVFNTSLQKNWTDEEKFYTVERNGKNITYNVEIGALYVYTHNKTTGMWDETTVSVPNKVMYLGGYGRVVGASKGMNKFAGAYYNKLRIGSKIPPTLGIVFVSFFDVDDVKMYDPIEPFDGLDDYNTQRFGVQVKFSGQDQLYIVVLDQSNKSKNSHAGTYKYKLVDGKWIKEKQVQFKGSSGYKVYATSIGVKTDTDQNTIIVMSATKDDGTNYIVLVNSDSTADQEPQQIIETGNDSPSYFEFCGDWLAVMLPSSVQIYKINESKQYSLFQTITDPKTWNDEYPENLKYEDLQVTFPGQFSWEPNKCNKCVIGAQSGFKGGLDRESSPFGRAYVFESSDNSGGGNPGGGNQGVGDDEKNGGPKDIPLIVGTTVAAVVVAIIVIVVVIVVVRNRNKDQSISEK
ncbi:hypothetical protein TRFO_36900 [Tritrichomonas foetus]|uniref:Uncharacterized protein n=1 Tax=Tritrichomonas foetus TaxID=1144522 RepID=A0A1J4JHL2_9EUKA|nr:hypothetical protein TRFO_36900 [Tritrichomonas foetus]|eukprot:OHS96973.1 hypothetical protein TRFO_36900 [Tritrichomonas foetus]